MSGFVQPFLRRFGFVSWSTQLQRPEGCGIGCAKDCGKPGLKGVKPGVPGVLVEGRGGELVGANGVPVGVANGVGIEGTARGPGRVTVPGIGSARGSGVARRGSARGWLLGFDLVPGNGRGVGNGPGLIVPGSPGRGRGASHGAPGSSHGLGSAHGPGGGVNGRRGGFPPGAGAFGCGLGSASTGLTTGGVSQGLGIGARGARKARVAAAPVRLVRDLGSIRRVDLAPDRPMRSRRARSSSYCCPTTYQYAHSAVRSPRPPTTAPGSAPRMPGLRAQPGPSPVGVAGGGRYAGRRGRALPALSDQARPGSTRIGADERRRGPRRERGPDGIHQTSTAVLARRSSPGTGDGGGDVGC